MRVFSISTIYILVTAMSVQAATIVGEWTAEVTGGNQPLGAIFIGGFEYESDAEGVFYIDDRPSVLDEFELRMTNFKEYPASKAWAEVDGVRREFDDLVIRVRNEVEGHGGFLHNDRYQVFGGGYNFLFSQLGDFSRATLLQSHDLPVSTAEFDFSGDILMRASASIPGLGFIGGDVLTFELKPVPEPSGLNLVICLLLTMPLAYRWHPKPGPPN